MDMFQITDLDERERFVRMTKALDRVYMKHTNDRLKADREKSKKANRKPPRGKRNR